MFLGQINGIWLHCLQPCSGSRKPVAALATKSHDEPSGD